MPEQPDQHNDQCDQEQDNGDAVHAMHELRIGILHPGRVAFPDIQILQNLPPDAFHGTNIRYFYAL